MKLNKKFFIAGAVIILMGAFAAPKVIYNIKLQSADTETGILKVINDYPDKPEAYMKLGDFYSLSNPQKAVEYYLKTIKMVKNKDFEAGLDEKIGFLYLKQNDTENAVKYFSNPRLVKNSILSNIMLAIIYKNIGEYDKAIDVLNSFEKDSFPTIIAADTNSIRRFVNIAMYPLLSSQQASDIKPSIIENKAKTYYEKAEYDKALELLKEYEALVDVPPYSDYLLVYMAKNDMANAGKYFDLIYKKANASMNMMDELASGLYFIKKKDYANAEKLFTEMSTPKSKNMKMKTPRMKYGYYGLGLLYKDRKNYNIACENFNKALEITPYWYKVKKELQECRCK